MPRTPRTAARVLCFIPMEFMKASLSVHRCLLRSLLLPGHPLQMAKVRGSNLFSPFTAPNGPATNTETVVGRMARAGLPTRTGDHQWSESQLMLKQNPGRDS